MKRKGDPGGNKSGEKRKGRRINHTNFGQVEVLCFIPIFPFAAPLEMISEKEGLGQNPNPKVEWK